MRAEDAGQDLVAVQGPESQLLGILLSHDAPMGARVAARALSDQGLELSEATVSRMLAKLDLLGYTKSVERKGRTLTYAGRKAASTTAIATIRNRKLNAALDIRNVQQLLDLLSARRGVERELARSAAIHRTDEDIELLQRSVEAQDLMLESGQDPYDLATNFHRAIAQIARNDLLQILDDALWHEAIQPLERIVDIVTANHGTTRRANTEHKEILDAILRQDADLAESAMAAHHTRLRQEVEGFAEIDPRGIFRLLISSAPQ